MIKFEQCYQRLVVIGCVINFIKVYSLVAACTTKLSVFIVLAVKANSQTVN